MSAEWSDRVRKAGAAAVADIEAQEWPFDADWDRWLPSLVAEVPELPSNWAVVDQPGTGA